MERAWGVGWVLGCDGKEQCGCRRGEIDMDRLKGDMDVTVRMQVVPMLDIRRCILPNC